MSFLWALALCFRVASACLKLGSSDIVCYCVFIPLDDNNNNSGQEGFPEGIGWNPGTSILRVPVNKIAVISEKSSPRIVGVLDVCNLSQSPKACLLDLTFSGPDGVSTLGIEYISESTNLSYMFLKVKPDDGQKVEQILLRKWKVISIGGFHTERDFGTGKMSDILDSIDGLVSSRSSLPVVVVRTQRETILHILYTSCHSSDDIMAVLSDGKKRTREDIDSINKFVQSGCSHDEIATLVIDKL
jgi:hypothetical protein